MYKNIIVKF